MARETETREPEPAPGAPDQLKLPPRQRKGVADAPGRADGHPPDAHDRGEGIGATEDQVGDRTGPGVGFDQEHPQHKDEGGVS